MKKLLIVCLILFGFAVAATVPSFAIWSNDTIAFAGEGDDSDTQEEDGIAGGD